MAHGAFVLMDSLFSPQLTGEHLRPVAIPAVADGGIPFWDAARNRVAYFRNDAANVVVPVPVGLQPGQEAVLFTYSSEDMLSPAGVQFAGGLLPAEGSVGDSVSAYPIARTLTFTGNAVAGESVTIGSDVYSWISGASSAYDVHVGATTSFSILGLQIQINTQAAGVLRAMRGVGDTLIVEVINPTSQDLVLATTETMTNASWDAATMPAVNAMTGRPIPTSFP